MQGQRVSVIETLHFARFGVKPVLVDHGAKMGLPDLDNHRRLAVAEVDRFLAHSHITPGAVPLVLERVGRIDL
jgi:hypothetical protein